MPARCWTIWILPLLAACAATTQAPALSGTYSAEDKPVTCTLGDISQQVLSLPDGDDVFVHPDALGTSGGGVLIGGMPNFIVPRSLQSSRTGLVRSKYFGVHVTAGGEISLIPSPLPARYFSAVRLLRAGENALHVVAAQAKLDDKGHPVDHPDSLWYGRLEGNRWAEWEAIPLPDTVQLVSRNAPALVQRGDTLYWALPTEGNPRWQQWAFIVFARSQQGWSHRTIATEASIAYVELAASDTTPLTATVVRPDRTLMSSQNELFGYVLSPESVVVRKLNPRSSGPAHRPTHTAGPQEHALSWLANSPDRAADAVALISRHGSSPREVPLGRSVVYASRPLPLGSSSWLWVLLRALEDDSGELSVVVVGENATIPTTIHRMPYPFDWIVFNAVLSEEGVLWIVGQHPEEGRAVNLLLRARVECGVRGSAARGASHAAP